MPITLFKKENPQHGERRRLQTRLLPLSIAQRGAASNEPSLSSHANEAPWQIISPEEIALSETEGAQVLKLLKVFCLTARILNDIRCEGANGRVHIYLLYNIAAVPLISG